MSKGDYYNTKTKHKHENGQIPSTNPKFQRHNILTPLGSTLIVNNFGFLCGGNLASVNISRSFSNMRDW
jgi:hypothetical protein